MFFVLDEAIAVAVVSLTSVGRPKFRGGEGTMVAVDGTVEAAQGVPLRWISVQYNDGTSPSKGVAVAWAVAGSEGEEWLQARGRDRRLKRRRLGGNSDSSGSKSTVGRERFAEVGL